MTAPKASSTPRIADARGNRPERAIWCFLHYLALTDKSAGVRAVSVGRPGAVQAIIRPHDRKSPWVAGSVHWADLPHTTQYIAIATKAASSWGCRIPVDSALENLFHMNIRFK